MSPSVTVRQRNRRKPASRADSGETINEEIRPKRGRVTIAGKVLVIEDAAGHTATFKVYEAVQVMVALALAEERRMDAADAS
jgi:hypothetical protein